MLCNFCSRFFDYKDSNLIQSILRIKRDAASEAKRLGLSAEVQQQVKVDDSRYKSELESRGQNEQPCPWPQATLPESPNSVLGTMSHESSARTVGQLLESARRTDCELCLRLAAMVEYAIDVELYKEKEITGSPLLDPITCKPRRLLFLCDIDRPAPVAFRFEVSLDLDPSTYRQPAGTTSGDDNCIKMLKQCLEECIASHPGCGRLIDDTWLPSRLIDVDPEMPDAVRLAERHETQSTSSQATPKYLSLSHMWGKERHLVTNKGNYDTFRRRISMSILPACFQDAVGIARKLKIQYIWIDSLCIIQDSAEDWNKEAVSMKSVYQNAVCNIAACDSTSSGQAMHRRRLVQQGSAFNVSREFSKASANFTVLPEWEHLIRDEAPLYQRGWVLQEKYLSHRTMNIAKFPFFECFHSVRSQLLPFDRPFKQSESLVLVPERASLYPVSIKPIKWYERWFEMVDRYSLTNLTFGSDKLIAFAGLAERFASGIQAPYYAGLWGDDFLHASLLWQVDRTDGVRAKAYAPRPKDYRAPSWSWAAVDARIRNDNSSAEVPLSHVVSISTKLRNTKATFGAVEGGELALRCKLFKVPDLKPFYRDLRDSWIQLDENPEGLKGVDIFFAPITETSDEDEENEEGDPVAAGLLLRRVSGNEAIGDENRKIFSRVGCARVSETGYLVPGDLTEAIDLCIEDWDASDMLSWLDDDQLEEVVIV